jgi:alpha-ribazole phosphatase
LNIFLIRHTEVAVGRAVCYGSSDVALADNYTQQRDQLRQHLPTEAPALIFSSPLTRCRILAEDLAASHALPPKTVLLDDRLREYHFGDWENQLWANLDRAALDVWMADFVNNPPPNGENFLQVYERVGAFWQEKINTLATEPTAPESVYVVAHGGTIRALLCLFLELPLQNAYRLSLDYGAVSKLTTNGQYFTIQYINR